VAITPKIVCGNRSTKRYPMPRYSHPDDIETFQDACKATFQSADNAMQRVSAYLAQHERKRANQPEWARLILKEIEDWHGDIAERCGAIFAQHAKRGPRRAVSETNARSHK
jgi:hypothetical protein